MRITDYEGGKNLSDVCVELTREEASDLALYLHRLLQQPEIKHVYLSEVRGTHIERELTVLMRIAGNGLRFPRKRAK